MIQEDVEEEKNKGEKKEWKMVYNF
jgi:hypothetical protein